MVRVGVRFSVKLVQPLQGTHDHKQFIIISISHLVAGRIYPPDADEQMIWSLMQCLCAYASASQIQNTCNLLNKTSQESTTDTLKAIRGPLTLPQDHHSLATMGVHSFKSLYGFLLVINSEHTAIMACFVA